MSRCEENFLVERRQSAIDRRQVEIHLLPAGERVLAHLAGLHRTELQSLGNVFAVPHINR